VRHSVAWARLFFPVDDHVQNLKHIAESFTGPFRKELEASPTRRVLHEGFLTKICSDGKGKHKRYTVRWSARMDLHLWVAP
jgi:hypothetical protein